MRKKPPPAAQTFRFSRKSRQSRCGSSSPVNSEKFFLSAPNIASSDIGGPVTPPAGSNLSVVSAQYPSFWGSDAAGELGLLVPRPGPAPEMRLVPLQEAYLNPRRSVAISTFSILSSLWFPSIPRPLHTPLSFLGPEHFQVSDTTSSELDFTLCVSPPPVGRHAQPPEELTQFLQPPCSADAVEAVWDLSHWPQARRCSKWRRFKHRYSPILCPRHGWVRDVFLCRCRIFAQNGPTARKACSTSS